MYRNLLLLGTLLLAGLFSHAQPYLDLGSVYYSHSPGKGMSDNKSMDLFDQFRVQVNMPLVMKKDSSVLNFSPAWETRRIRFDETLSTTNLNSLFLVTTFTKPLSKRWSLTVGVIPRWNGESSVLFSRGFQLGGLFYASRTMSRALKLRAGLYYNREFFGNFFIPIVGIEWKINPRMNLFGNLPQSLTFEHRPGNRWAWGGIFRTFPNSYRIEPVGVVKTLDYYRLTDIQTGVYADLYLTRKLVLNLEGGYALFRKLRIGGESIGGRDTETIMTDKGSPYVRAALYYRLRFY